MRAGCGNSPYRKKRSNHPAAGVRTVFCLSLGAAHADAERFDQPPVLNARRAGRFATAAVEAQIEVPFDGRPQIQATVRHGPHQVDAARGTVVLIPCFEVSRTGRGAQAAMNAVEETAIVNVRADAFGRRRCWLGTGLALR